jgi:hypothetical protein
MHEGQNGRTSSRHQAEIHLESHVHGKRACVVWGRADEKGLSYQYLVSRLFHSTRPITGTGKPSNCFRSTVPICARNVNRHRRSSRQQVVVNHENQERDRLILTRSKCHRVTRCSTTIARAWSNFCTRPKLPATKPNGSYGQSWLRLSSVRRRNELNSKSAITNCCKST